MDREYRLEKACDRLYDTLVDIHIGAKWAKNLANEDFIDTDAISEELRKVEKMLMAAEDELKDIEHLREILG